jgi:serine/threonine protein kinase
MHAKQIVTARNAEHADALVGARFSLAATTYRITHRIARGGCCSVLSASTTSEIAHPLRSPPASRCPGITLHARPCVSTGTRPPLRAPIHVAVKVPLHATVANPALLERLQLEAKLLLNLHHPNLVEAIADGTWGERPCLVMERIEGHSLARLLRRERHLPLANVLHIVEDVLLALVYLEEDGRIIAHRDIKPGNIMLARDGTAKLIDLGSARTVIETSPRIVTDLVGSLPYSAPEQMLHASNADMRSDLYSLGTVLFEAFTGRRPFASASRRGLLSDKQHADLPPIGLFHKLHEQPELAHECNHLMTRSLAPLPDERYQTPSEFLRDVRIARQLLHETTLAEHTAEARRVLQQIRSMKT